MAAGTATVVFRVDTSRLMAALEEVREAYERLAQQVAEATTRAGGRGRPSAFDRIYLRTVATEQYLIGRDHLTELLERMHADIGLPFIPPNITLGEE
ncbi:hypothetical protein [Mumia sp. DW29H23]|uniref:hypothetical protein n=1 Tax=Mumia sp. DW29H23 TaxID=3421241 RepID=UPI003D69D1A5